MFSNISKILFFTIRTTFVQKPKRAGWPVHPLTVLPALRRTRCPRTLWTSWKTSINLDGKSISNAEHSSSTCRARRWVFHQKYSRLNVEGFHDLNKWKKLPLSICQELRADELSECVQDFYQNMADRLMSHYKGWFRDLNSQSNWIVSQLAFIH